MKTFFSKSSQGDHISLMSMGFDKSLPECNPEFDLFSFYDEKRENIWSDFVEKRSTCIPGILDFPIPRVRRSISSISQATECMFYPLDQSFIGIYHVESYFVTGSSFPNYFLKINTTLSVNDSSKICQFRYSPHAKNVPENEFKLHRKRLNPRDHCYKCNYPKEDNCQNCLLDKALD